MRFAIFILVPPAACGVLLAAAPLVAQQSGVHGDVSGSNHATSAQDTAVDQISSPAAPGEAELVAPEQLSGDGERQPVAQLTTPADAEASPGPQLSSGNRSAAAPAALSSRDEGRPAPVVRLDGHDRCDPANEERPDIACADAIENRAAEFTRPDPTELTPEQRLLIAQRAQDVLAGADNAAKRIGRNDVDPDDAGAQGLASIVLPDPPSAPSGRPSKPEQESTSGTPVPDLVQTITQLLQQQPQ